MSYTLFLEHLRKNVRLTPEEETQLLSKLQERHIAKKEFLYKEGDIHTGQAFVLSGCLRSYSVDASGIEHILQFAPPGWWIADINSLKNQIPSSLQIDAIENSSLLFLSRTHMEALYASIPMLERFFRLLLENSLITYQKRLLDNLSLSARERYENFCKLYPGLIMELPQKQVAAYIGVTPEFLSKMLNQPRNK